MHHDVRAHLDQGFRESEAVLVDRLVHDRDALRLGERDDQRLLPVGHESRMHVGLHLHRLEGAPRVVEADAVLMHLEGAAGLAEDVEEGHQLLLLRAADEDVALGGERRGGPAGGLVAVEDGAMGVAAQRLDALDEDRAVRLDPDDRAHLLQHRDQVHDLGLDGGVLEFGDPTRAHGGEQHLLGGTDARVRQLDVGAVQTVRGGDADALVALVDDRAEGTQRIHVEVDRPVADAAAAEIRDERLADAVQQRAAEQDGDAARSGQRVDLREVRPLDIRRVEHEHALLGTGHRDPVCVEHPGHDRHVADLGDVLQDAGGVAEQRRDHRLGGEILRPAHLDAPAQRLAAVDHDLVGTETHACSRLLGVLREIFDRVHLCSCRHAPPVPT